MKPDEKEAENIRVAVRCRPMNDREIREQAVSCFLAKDGNAVLTNLENPSEKHEFGYDFVYGCDSLQESVFQDIGVPILDRAFGGYNGTIFAYGQTGSGKTFSMSGVSGSDVLEGLIPRMNKSIFDRIQIEKQSDPNKLFLVECSFFEIYNEIIYDLLDASGNSKKNKSGLEIKEHSVLGIYVKDLQERVVESRDEVIDLMAQGAMARTVGYTQMNSESSRSHSIFVIKIHQKDATDESKNIFAKINLVDLAGSERAASTGAQGDRLKEGANINKSLSALGNVINALVEASRTGKKVFIPYRNSKLTRVLQESLGGNSLCSMLATLSPANINYPETLSTLKYASRAKSIKVNAKKNEASSQISQLNDEIATLKKKLLEQTEVTLGLDPKEKDEIVKAYEKQIHEMDRIRLQTWEDKAKLSKQHELERKRLAKERALADQKIRDERTRKWKLLQEKGDVELMLRALRDLDRAPSGALGATGCSATEERWLTQVAKLKALESASKDHRTLIMVFKDALQKDVDVWSKRSSLAVGAGVSGSTTTTKRGDDSAASYHMTASQLCNKLQNIHDESTQLVGLEHQLVAESSALISDISSEILRFKAYRAKLKATTPAKPAAVSTTASTTTTSSSKQPAAAANASKEVEQVLDEREKGLLITLTMVQTQRTGAVAFITRERKRVFDFASVTTPFVQHMNDHVASASVNSESDATWRAVKTKVLAVAATWRTFWEEADANSSSSTTADAISTDDVVAIGDVAPLGMASKLIYDESLVVSSKKSDAKHTRMGSAQFWLPDETDATPSLLIDLELPRCFHALQLRGGCFNGTTTLPHPSTSSSGLASGTDATTDSSNSSGMTKTNADAAAVNTFVLPPPEQLASALSTFQASEITGDHDQTYAILSTVMSWLDLLKTSVVPTKLFARPPVRFLHDVISLVIQNTGYAAALFSASERDYAQLSSKTERADYLTKILDAVQETYRSKHERALSSSSPRDSTSVVLIAATATNILAGKESADTLKFLSYFALVAIEHAIDHRPATQTPRVTTPRVQAPETTDNNSSSNGEESNGATLRVANSQDAAASEEAIASSIVTELPSVRDCWVTKIRVTTSVNGKDWHPLGDYDANTDAANVTTIVLDASAGDDALPWSRMHPGLVGRYIKLSCVAWHDLPLLQVELLGQEVRDGDALTSRLETLGATAIALLQALRETAALLLDEAKVSWEKAIDVERAKQEELTTVSEELVASKRKCIAFETHVSELTQTLAQLQQRYDDDTKKLSDERTKSEKLHRDLQTATATIDDVKKKHDTLERDASDQRHAMQTLTFQHSEQTRTMQELEHSKRALETLSTNLQAQLENRDQQDGHTESKLASISGELMAANVLVDELKRKLETSEQMRREQEAFNADLHAQLQQQRAAMMEKEHVHDESLRQKQAACDDALDALRSDRTQIQASLEQATASELRLRARTTELEALVKTLQEQTEALTKKLRDTEASVSAAATSAATTAAAANAEAGEKLLLEAQTKELRCLAELEKMEAKVQALESAQLEAGVKARDAETERQSLLQRIATLEEVEEEMQLQLQVVTEERDSARQKEEQLFTENNEKEQEIERIRDGYDRMNSKEDELNELQEQIEKYQSLLEITSAANGGSNISKKKNDTHVASDTANLQRLYALAFGGDNGKATLEKSDALMHELERWIEHIKKSDTVSTAAAAPSLKTTADSKTSTSGTASAPATKHDDASNGKPAAVTPLPLTATTAATSNNATPTATSASKASAASTAATAKSRPTTPHTTASDKPAKTPRSSNDNDAKHSGAATPRSARSAAATAAAEPKATSKDDGDAEYDDDFS